MAESNLAVSLLDRAAKLVMPSRVETFTPAPRVVTDGLWVVTRKLSLPPLLTLSTHMTLVRLADGRLIVLSPVPSNESLFEEIDRIGDVAAIVAPNTFHYCYVKEWVGRFPNASLWNAPGLAERVPDLPAGSVLSDLAPSLWADELEQIVFGPAGPFSEVAFFHRSSKTLILTDLAFNLRQFENPLQQVAWRLMGVPTHLGPSRTARFTLLRDRDLAVPYLRRIAGWDFERVIVAHGDIVETDAHRQFERGFAGYL